MTRFQRINLGIGLAALLLVALMAAQTRGDTAQTSPPACLGQEL